MLMREAAKEYGWKLNNAGIALMWRGGAANHLSQTALLKRPRTNRLHHSLRLLEGHHSSLQRRARA